MKKKVILGKNQVVLSALVMMIAVAGYLNYLDSSATSDAIVLTDTGEIAALINEDNSMPTFANENDSIEELNVVTQSVPFEVASVEEKSEPGEAIFVSSQMDSPYFVQAKLEREQSRAKQKDILSEMINNDSIDENQRSEFADEMLEMQKRIEKETAAETMIEAKGFGEAYVRIDDETVDVVVNKENLSEQDVAQIQDIVERKTGMEPKQIRISPMTKNK